MLAGAGFLVLILFVALAIAVVVTWYPPRVSGTSSMRPLSSPSPAGPPAPVPAVPLPDGASVCGVDLGFLGPLTGAAATLGLSIEQGARLAVDQYNSGHPGCEVNLVAMDSGGDPTRAQGQTQGADSDQMMLGLVGPVLSDESQAALPQLDRAAIATITPSASRSTLSARGWRVFHRAIPSDVAQGPAAAHYILDVLHASKVFVVDDGSDYGVAMTGGLRPVLAGAVVGTARVPAGDSFAATVASIQASGASVVYYGGFYDTAGVLLRQMRTAGVTATLVGGDGMDDSSLADSAGGQSIDGTAITSLSMPTVDPGFRAAFRDTYGTDPGSYSATAYDAANIFLLGIGHGVGTRPDMLAFVSGYAGSGLAGRYRFTTAGELDPSLQRVAILVYRDGQFTYKTSEPAG